MKYFAFMSASVLALSMGTAAMADPINYTPNFSGATGLSYGGAGALTGSSVTLTNVANFNQGAAVWATNALSFDPTLNFQSDFSFNIGAQSTGLAGNGFTFVLTTNPTALGSVHQNLGLGPLNETTPPSVEVQFSTFANQHNNPTFAPGQYYSNLIAVSTDGNVVIPQNSNSYASPYGVEQCDNQTATKSTRAGCLANGDIWKAAISYQNGLLSVAVCDPKEAGGTCTASSYITVLTGYAISLASILGDGPIYAGFTASNGAVSETVQIDSWNLSPVPEPASLAALGAGIAALGLVSRRRRANAGV